jgi:glycosyltransferase involved in cell wall biosynthesis
VISDKEASHPFVSIIIPTRNEENYISQCLESVVSQTYPHERLEVLVVDGRSEDSTRDMVAEYARRHPFISLVDNPRGIVPAALNTGIQASRGDVIVRLDAHTRYDSHYVEECVRSLRETDADNVGGGITTLPGADTPTARAIAAATSHPFGVGNSKFRTSAKAQFVDTVPFGAFRRQAFDRLGLFNEHLVRNQDIEFNSRIRRAGGRVYLNPHIRSFYYNQATFSGLWRQNFSNGRWNIYTHALSGHALSLRHYVPLLFLLTLLSTGVWAAFSPLGGATLAAVSLSYLCVNLAFSLFLTRNGQANLLPRLVWTFMTLHVSYGIGSLWGLLSVGSWKKSLSSSGIMQQSAAGQKGGA